MSRTVSTEFMEQLREGAPAALRLTLLLATIGSIVVAPVDFLVAEGGDLTAALILRVGVFVIFAATYVASYYGSWAKRHGRLVSLLACQVVALEISLLSYFAGGASSTYHEALYIVMLGYAVLPFPWEKWDGIVTMLSIVLIYNFTMFAGDRLGTPSQLLGQNALLLVTAIVAAVVERVITAAQRRDFESRRALADANERLTALDTAKTRFFSNISHELRTPLTLIVAPLEAMLESSREPLGEGQRERLRLAQRNALRLLRLVDDLLSLTRAEAASLKLHVRRFDLAELLETFVIDVKELAARKRIEVELERPEEAPIVEADPTLIERILLNLFGNSAKFVDRGGHIRLAVRPSGEGYELVVADDGPGIAKESLARIFDRFYQADSGSTRAHGGTGIGLALVKEICELHGGRVSVESTLGEGTTIRCWLPRDLPARSEPHVVRSRADAIESQGLPEWHQQIRTAKSYRLQAIDDATERRVAPRPRPRGDAPSILVVEDNPDMIRFLVALLAHDYRVFSAQNGKQGLRMALDRRPDLIISDVMMPEMDGFEMARQLRQDETGAKIPLIFLTARGSSDDRIEGHSGGADTYLAKPFRSEELIAAVEALLARQQRIRDAESENQDEAMVFMASGILEHLERSLGNIMALQHLMRERKGISEEQRTRYTQTLGTLTALVDGLRRLTAAKPRDDTPLIPVDEALREIADGMTEHLPTGRTLNVELSTRASVAITAADLEAVVRPLLVRAIEVTPAGRDVFLQSFQHVGGESSRKSISIVVRDRGPALTSGQIERMFFPFLSSDLEIDAALELARARRIALVAGGTITVEADTGQGNRVTIVLPIALAVATEAAA